MSKQKHTAGPLTIHGPSRKGSPIHDGGDYAILDVKKEIIGEAFHHVAKNEDRPALANATLWAAAPDLLAACEAILEWLPHIRVVGTMPGGVVIVKRQLQQAVAKATEDKAR